MFLQPEDPRVASRYPHRWPGILRSNPLLLIPSYVRYSYSEGSVSIVTIGFVSFLHFPIVLGGIADDGHSWFCPLGGGGAPSANIPSGITVAAQVFLQLQWGTEDGPFLAGLPWTAIIGRAFERTFLTQTLVGPDRQRLVTETLLQDRLRSKPVVSPCRQRRLHSPNSC